VLRSIAQQVTNTKKNNVIISEIKQQTILLLGLSDIGQADLLNLFLVAAYLYR
jgi:hypothetical protein